MGTIAWMSFVTTSFMPQILPQTIDPIESEPILLVDGKLGLAWQRSSHSDVSEQSTHVSQAKAQNRLTGSQKVP